MEKLCSIQVMSFNRCINFKSCVTLWRVLLHKTKNIFEYIFWRVIIWSWSFELLINKSYAIFSSVIRQKCRRWEMFVFREIWRALFSWKTRFKIRPFALSTIFWFVELGPKSRSFLVYQSIMTEQKPIMMNLRFLLLWKYVLSRLNIVNIID